jgi:hypothetical protein
MATNFKITFHRNSENLHFKLAGDFDGSSAFRLLDAIRSHSNHPMRIFIHTNTLKTVEPFGLDVFHTHVDLLKKKSIELVFTGKYSTALVPDISPPFRLSVSVLQDDGDRSIDKQRKLYGQGK